MPILKPEDYILYKFDDKGNKLGPSGYAQKPEDIIRYIRIREKESLSKYDSLFLITKQDKKNFNVLFFNIETIDANGNSIPLKDLNNKDIVNIKFSQNSSITPFREEKGKKEMTEFISNKEIQDQYISDLLSMELSGWKIIQDPWDPNVTPPLDIPPTTTTTTTLVNNEITTTTKTTNPPKIKMNIVGIPDGLTIKAKEDLSDFTIYVGDIPKEKTGNMDDFNNMDELDEEYTEGSAQIADELGMSPEEYAKQDEVSKNQENSDVSPSDPGPPAEIKPVGSFDSLLQLAGKCARELGKNPRVKYENLKQGYVKGVHGLCPQGTQAVLYALTGIKELGMQRGNADHFSFKSPTNPPGGEGKAGFAKTGYYNDKVKVGLKDYVNDKSKWQIGDIIAVGYTEGRDYGHIQVWTGVSWMSDFTQNGIQKNHVDWDSMALWRLNSKGLEAVKKQSGQISGLA